MENCALSCQRRRRRRRRRLLKNDGRNGIADVRNHYIIIYLCLAIGDRRRIQSVSASSPLQQANARCSSFMTRVENKRPKII